MLQRVLHAIEPKQNMLFASQNKGPGYDVALRGNRTTFKGYSHEKMKTG